MEGEPMKTRFPFALAIIFSLAVLQISAEESDDPSLLAQQDEETVASPSDEVFKLFNKAPGGLEINGWMAIGNGGLADIDILNIGVNPGNIGLNQLGFSMDKAGEKYRLHLDLLYGRDAAYFQSHQNAGNGWDNSAGFDHNDYAWALPQAFAEGAVGDWTVRGGHFLFASSTGQYSNDRFFATRTVTETATLPFTLTGLTLTGKVGEVDTTLGWAAGVNTGFDTDSADNSVFVIGARRALGDKLSVSYNALIGDHNGGFPLPASGTEAYEYYHEVSGSYAASEKLTVQLTHLYVAAAGRTLRTIRQSAYYVLSDTMTLGQRYECFRSEDFTNESATVGINYQRPNWSNVMLRPEIRWDDNGTDQQTEFYMDVVVTF